MDTSMHQNTKTAKHSLLTTLALSLALVATTSAVHGAGFAIYENDARSFAMGNANVGRSDDAAALYTNPAGITQLPGFQIKAGISLIQPSVDVTTTDLYSGQSTKYSMNDYTSVIPHLYSTYRITDDIAVGLGVFVPYGLKSDFQKDPHSWAGAYNNYMTEIKTVEIAPTFAYRIVHDQSWAKQISVAVGLAILHSDIDLRRQTRTGGGATPDTFTYTPLILQGNGWDYGYNLALQWEVNDQVSFGIVYRSGFKLEYNRATAEYVGIEKAKASGEIDLPDSWTFGVNYSPVAPLNIGVQATRTNWSSYDELTIATRGFTNGAMNWTRTSEKQWKDVWRYSVGAEYQVNNALALRGGFVIDKDPVNTNYADFMVPSNDRQIFSLGLGWTINKTITLDFAYAYLKIRSSNIAARPAEGIFTNAFVNTGHANIFSASANFRF